MADTNARVPDGATGVLVLASGVVLFGRGFGAVGSAVGDNRAVDVEKGVIRAFDARDGALSGER